MAQIPSKPVVAQPFRSTETKATQPAHAPQFIFGKQNYIIFLVAIAVVILGFVLMSGTTDIYSTTKIAVAPVVVLIGFGIGFFAIFKKPDNRA